MTALFLRGFVQVVFVSLNVVCISRRLWVPMALSSLMISGLWYANVGKASHDPRWRSLAAYACGAMCGTIAGALIGGWL